MTELDVEQGQIYSIAVDDGEGPVLAEFTKEPGDGTLVFERRKTGRPIYIEVGEFEDMRCDGRANLVPVYTIKSPNAPPVEAIDPIALADPHEPGITISESKKRLAAAARLLKARTLRFYVERFDQQPSLGRGAVKIRHFIAENYPDAFAKGFLWKPDPATLLRAADRCGETHNRPLAAFFDQRGKHDRTKRWSTEVTEAAAHMIALYWSKASVRQIDAISHFIDKVEGPDVPDDETLRLWIRQAESYENYREKFGELEADRRYKGRGRAVTATRPLEYVMIDHTRVDAWAVVLNDAGRPMLIERPWLTIAIDAYSRMVLGLVLTFEPPSVWSALECLKDVVRKKNYLVRRYGFHKGATDGWGRPYTVICDNGWEFTGLSFQMACEAAGIDVMWAPVKTPMFKAYVERMFGRLNDEVWHKLPSGIPFKPHVMSELKLDPKVKAVHTREQLEGAVWNAIVTMYHLEEHSGIGMAPAKKWREGLRAKSRATVADVSKLDALLGQVKRVQLSAEGVHLSNERFHDEEVTFDLLNRLLRYGKVREQRRNRLSSGTVWVVATINQADVSYVEIWDYSRNISVRLPNWDTESTHGLSWKVREMNRQFADAENLAFHTPKERARARVLHEKFLEMRLDGEGLAMARAAKATSVFAANPLPADDPKLVKGDQVVFQKTDGNHTIAAEEQSGSRLPGKLRPRGGKGKAVSTRAKKANLKALREEAERQLKSLAAGKPIDAVDMPSPPPSASDGDGSARDRVRKDQEKW